MSLDRIRPLMKVTLIHPPQLVSLTNYLTCTAIPPLGLSYIAATTRSAGHSVRVIDAVGEGLDIFNAWETSMHLRGLPFKEIVERIPEDTDVVGIGCMFSPQWPSTRELIALIRKRFPGVKMVIGGEHPSALSDLVLKTSHVDIVVKGEGEETFVELLQALSQEKPPDEIPGVVVKETHPRPFVPRKRIQDIDAICWPAWNLFPIEKYIAFNQPHGAARGRSMPMLATRGCPYQCTFCSSPQMWTTRWYPRNPNLVADEMGHYIKVYQANDFHFEDLTAIIKKEWIIDFSRILIERNLNVTWQLPSGTRSEAIDEEVMVWMRKAGARNLSYAPESGSKRILKLIKKHVHLDHLFRAAKAAIRNKMVLQVNIVMGFPEETFVDILKTYWFIVRCGLIGFSEVHIACFYPLPHTEQFNNLQKKGRLPSDNDLDDNYFYTLFQGTDPKRPISWNERFSNNQMKLFILFGYFLFFSPLFLVRPWRLTRMLQNICQRKSESKTERILLGTFEKIFNLKKIRIKNPSGRPEKPPLEIIQLRPKIRPDAT